MISCRQIEWIFLQPSPGTKEDDTLQQIHRSHVFHWKVIFQPQTHGRVEIAVRMVI